MYQGDDTTITTTSYNCFTALWSRTIRVTQYQKDKPFLVFTEAEMMGWHQLDHMQVICSSLHTDNHASTTSLMFFTGQMLFLQPNQQRQSTEIQITK